MDNDTKSYGKLYIVATPIGNLEDITYRAINVLKSVDAIVAEDTRKSILLLNRYNFEKRVISYHSYNERRRTNELLKLLKAGNSLALVSDAGTPGISDPGYYIVRECIKEGIDVIAIPGAAAFLAALTVSGLPMERFVFEGFLPHIKGRKKRIAELKNEERTMIFYESPHRILKLLRELIAEWGDRNAAVVRELTKKFEEIVRGSLSDIEQHFQNKNIKGEFVVVVKGRKNKK